LELARLLNTRVIAAVGSPAKANIVRDHGADAVIECSSEDVRERVKALTGGEGIDGCVDNVGGKLFATLARLMRWNGRLLPVGFTSGEVPSIPMNLPLLKNYSIVGMFSGAWTNRCPEEVECAMQAIMQWAGEGKLKPHSRHSGASTKWASLPRAKIIAQAQPSRIFCRRGPGILSTFLSRCATVRSGAEAPARGGDDWSARRASPPRAALKKARRQRRSTRLRGRGGDRPVGAFMPKPFSPNEVDA
jgi:hypothetical protein